METTPESMAELKKLARKQLELVCPSRHKKEYQDEVMFAQAFLILIEEIETLREQVRDLRRGR